MNRFTKIGFLYEFSYQDQWSEITRIIVPLKKQFFGRGYAKLINDYQYLGNHQKAIWLKTISYTISYVYSDYYDRGCLTSSMIW